MKQSLPGLLLRVGELAAKHDKTHGPGYRYALNELNDNLRELRDRSKAGDMTALDEFFAIYVFDEQ